MRKNSTSVRRIANSRSGKFDQTFFRERKDETFKYKVNFSDKSHFPSRKVNAKIAVKNM